MACIRVSRSAPCIFPCRLCWAGSRQLSPGSQPHRELVLEAVDELRVRRLQRRTLTRRLCRCNLVHDTDCSLYRGVARGRLARRQRRQLHRRRVCGEDGGS